MDRYYHCYFMAKEIDAYSRERTCSEAYIKGKIEGFRARSAGLQCLCSLWHLVWQLGVPSLTELKPTAFVSGFQNSIFCFSRYQFPVHRKACPDGRCLYPCHWCHSCRSQTGAFKPLLNSTTDHPQSWLLPTVPPTPAPQCLYGAWFQRWTTILGLWHSF